jgi:hypothetical protein
MSRLTRGSGELEAVGSLQFSRKSEIAFAIVLAAGESSKKRAIRKVDYNIDLAVLLDGAGGVISWVELDRVGLRDAGRQFARDRLVDWERVLRGGESQRSKQQEWRFVHAADS